MNRDAYSIRFEADRRHAVAWGLHGFKATAELVEVSPDVFRWHYSFMTEFPMPGLGKPALVLTSVTIDETTIDFLKWMTEEIDNWPQNPAPLI